MHNEHHHLCHVSYCYLVPEPLWRAQPCRQVYSEPRGFFKDFVAYLQTVALVSWLLPDRKFIRTKRWDTNDWM